MYFDLPRREVRQDPPPFHSRGTRTKRVEVYLTNEEYEHLQALAYDIDRSLAATLRRCFHKYYKVTCWDDDF